MAVDQKTLLSGRLVLQLGQILRCNVNVKGVLTLSAVDYAKIALLQFSVNFINVGKSMNSMSTKHFLLSIVLLVLGLSGGISALQAEQLTARQIMERVDALDDGDHLVQDMEMVLIDKKGRERKRQLKVYGRDWGETGEDKQSIMFFTSPADIKNTGFLSYDYDAAERDDDQWLYLPALKKTKRIASADKSSSFMGTDFTYADMTKRKLENYDYKLLKEEEVRGHKVWLIEAIPNNEKEIKETGYTKSIVYIRQDNFFAVRSVIWVKKGKKLKYMDVQKLEKIDGIWIATQIEMALKKNKNTLHKTRLIFSNVRFNQPMDKDIFTVRQLEKGV